MPGGAPEAYARVEPIFSAIAAKVGDEPCVTYIGPGGAGHYVKMVHNGIEYGALQLIAEIYDLMGRGLRISAEDMSAIFRKWNRGELESYLVEITGEILARLDEESGKALVEVILDQATQKGTGKWTSQEAFDLGVPIPTISAAVEARSLSAFQAEREAMAAAFSRPQKLFSGPTAAFAAVAGEALYAAMVLVYAQGMDLLKAASREHEYDLNLSEIARIWRGGCIIRARLLEEARQAYSEEPGLLNLSLWPPFQQELKNRIGSLQHVMATAIDLGIPVPALSATLAYYDSYRSERLPANLIQAQRDYFGAHTYRRVDKPGNFHTDWGKE
jgi:6-phosphogluconate dehydrogenase